MRCNFFFNIIVRNTLMMIVLTVDVVRLDVHLNVFANERRTGVAFHPENKKLERSLQSLHYHYTTGLFTGSNHFGSV